MVKEFWRGTARPRRIIPLRRPGGSVRRRVADSIDLRHFRGKASGWAVPDRSPASSYQEGYRQEFSVDWLEAPQCRLVVCSTTVS